MYQPAAFRNGERRPVPVDAAPEQTGGDQTVELRPGEREEAFEQLQAGGVALERGLAEAGGGVRSDDPLAIRSYR